MAGKNQLIKTSKTSLKLLQRCSKIPLNVRITLTMFEEGKTGLNNWKVNVSLYGQRRQARVLKREAMKKMNSYEVLKIS